MGPRRLAEPALLAGTVGGLAGGLVAAASGAAGPRPDVGRDDA